MDRFDRFVCVCCGTFVGVGSYVRYVIIGGKTAPLLVLFLVSFTVALGILAITTIPKQRGNR